MKPRKRHNIKLTNLLDAARNSANLRSDQHLKDERSRHKAQRSKLYEAELERSFMNLLKDNEDIIKCVQSLENAKKAFIEEYDQKLSSLYESLEGNSIIDSQIPVCTCERLATGLESTSFVTISVCSKEEHISEHPLVQTMFGYLSQIELTLTEDNSESTVEKFKTSCEAGLPAILYDLLNWTSKYHINSTLLPNIIELLVYRILLMLSNLICVDDQPFMKQPFVDSLHIFIFQPTTLRAKQLAYLCLCEIAETSPLSSLTSKTKDDSNHLDVAKELITISYALASAVMSKGASLFENQINIPFGGSNGLLRVIFRFLATITQYETADICHLVLTFARVHVSFLLAFLQQTSTILQKSADNDQRATFSELLWILSNCLPCYSKNSLNNEIAFETCTLATSIWEFLGQCFFIDVHSGSPPLNDINPEISSEISSIVYHLPVDLLTRLNLEKTDLLIPGFVLLRQICELDFQISNGDFVLNQLLKLEQNIQEHQDTFLFGVIGKGLMSQHGRLLLESCVILSLIAKISSSEHLQFVSLFLPVLIRILLQKQQYYLVKRAIIIILIELAFNPDNSLFEVVLNCEPIDLEKFNSTTREIFPHTFTEFQILHDTPVCLLCQKVSVIDAVVSQFNKDQQDLVLIDLCFDFLDKALTKMPTLKKVLLKHDIINVVESVQFLNDENLFQNSIRFVEKYYDDAL